MLAAAVPVLAGVSLSAADPGVIVSIVSDATPGPGAKHGMGKLTAALKAKECRPETAASFEAAPGDIVIVSVVPAARPTLPRKYRPHNRLQASQPANNSSAGKQGTLELLKHCPPAKQKGRSTVAADAPSLKLRPRVRQSPRRSRGCGSRGSATWRRPCRRRRPAWSGPT